MAGQTIISIAYGIDVLPKDDPYIDTAESAGHRLSSAAVSGAFLVDTLPILKHVPEWMPFAGFKRKAREWRVLAEAMCNAPFQATLKNIVRFSRPTATCIADLPSSRPKVKQSHPSLLSAWHR